MNETTREQIDEAAAAELDKLFQTRGVTELSAREQLTKIRKGLRESTISDQSLLSWVSRISGWPADPMTNEIFYHAADPQAPRSVRANAIYFEPKRGIARIRRNALASGFCDV